MPLPELPLNLHDPSHTLQTEGEHEQKDIWQTHRGPKPRPESPADNNHPQEALRYDD